MPFTLQLMPICFHHYFPKIKLTKILLYQFFKMTLIVCSQKGLNEVPRGNRRVILQSTRIFDFKEQFCVGTSFSFWDQTGECKNKCHFKVTFVHDHFWIRKIVTRKGNSPKTSSLGNFHSIRWRFQFFTWCFLKRHEAVETAWKAKQVVKETTTCTT